MIGFFLYHWKIIPISITIWMTAAAVLIADQSPSTPYLLGALVTVGMAILAMLWRIQGRMSVVETQMHMTPLWTALQKEVAASLHNPELRDKEADVLIEDLETKMTPAKVSRLRMLMIERSKDMTRSEQERRRAELLLFIMGQVLKEKENTAKH